MARSSLLLLLLVACGRTDHDGQLAASAGDHAGGTTAVNAAGSNASGGTDVGAAGAGGVSQQSCLYPTTGLAPINIASDMGAQSFQLSAPFDLDVTPATWGGLAASYDVNGDLVSDLIYLDSGATPPRFRLAISDLPPNELDFREVDCPALTQLPVGRLFLRDLDADEVADLVVGTTRGVQAFLNHVDGLERVLDYRFPSPTLRASIINVGAIDLDGDQRADLVIGFDVLRQETESSADVGARAFMQQADGQLSPGDQFVSNASFGLGFHGEPYPGYLAVGRFGSNEAASAILVSYNQARPLGTIGDQTTFDGTPVVPLVVPEVDEQIFQLLSLPTRLGHANLLAIGSSTAFVLDLSLSPPQLRTRIPLHSPGGYSHELGGGPELPRYFLQDLEHDGDADFLLQIPDGELVLYPNLGAQGFTVAQTLTLSVSGEAESPFLTVGPGSAIVADGAPGDSRAAVYTLMPAYPRPKSK